MSNKVKKEEIIEFIKMERIDSSKSKLIKYLLWSLQDGLVKNMSMPVFHSCRIMTELFIDSFWNKLSIDIQQSKSVRFEAGTGSKKYAEIIRKILNKHKNDLIFASDKNTNEKVVKILGESIGFHLNEGSHYNVNNSLVSNNIRKDDKKLIVEIFVIFINLLNDYNFVYDDKFDAELSTFINDNLRNNSQTYVYHEYYLNTGQLNLEKFKSMSEDSFLIPFYQRGYVWGEEQIKTFLLDSKEYYRGSLTLRLEKNIWHVIDGQQRLTTLIIFYEKFIPESGINIENTIKYEIEGVNKEKLKEARKIIEGIYKKLNKRERDELIINIRKSYFSMVNLPSENSEVNNFRNMNIASIAFKKHELSRTKFISENWEENFTEYEEDEKIKNLRESITFIEKKLNGMSHNTMSLESYWNSIGYLIKNEKNVDADILWSLYNYFYFDKEIVFLMNYSTPYTNLPKPMFPRYYSFPLIKINNEEVRYLKEYSKNLFHLLKKKESLGNDHLKKSLVFLIIAFGLHEIMDLEEFSFFDYKKMLFKSSFTKNKINSLNAYLVKVFNEILSTIDDWANKQEDKNEIDWSKVSKSWYCIQLLFTISNFKYVNRFDHIYTYKDFGSEIEIGYLDYLIKRFNKSLSKNKIRDLEHLLKRWEAFISVDSNSKKK